MEIIDQRPYDGEAVALVAQRGATDLATEHGATDANKRDGARQLGRLNVADLQL
jgi:hypothetical protein